MGDICRRILCYLCTLSATYVAWHLSVWISQVYCSIVAVISTQFSMMSPCENETLYVVTFNMISEHFCGVCAKLLKKLIMTNLGANMIKHVFEKELYILKDSIICHFIKFQKAWTLESDSFNREISVDKTLVDAWTSPIVHKGRLSGYSINI